MIIKVWNFESFCSFLNNFWANPIYYIIIAVNIAIDIIDKCFWELVTYRYHNKITGKSFTLLKSIYCSILFNKWNILSPSFFPSFCLSFQTTQFLSFFLSYLFYFSIFTSYMIYISFKVFLHLLPFLLCPSIPHPRLSMIIYWGE